MDALISPRFAEIAVDGTLPGGDSATLTYLVPPERAASLTRGALVWVPLRRRATLGVVVDLHDNQPDFEVRQISEVVPAGGLTLDQLELGCWLQRETASSLFGCLSLMLPPGVLIYPM